MDDSKKYRLALTGLIVLLLVNIVTIVSMWRIHPPRPDVPGKEDTKVQGFFQRELELSPEQIESYNVLREEQRQKTRQIHRNLNAHRRAYFTLIEQPDSLQNEAVRDSLARLMGNEYLELERVNFEHFSKMRKLLNKEQREKLKKVMNESLFRRGQRNGMQHGMNSPNKGPVNR